MTRLEATRIVVELPGDAPIVASLGHPAYDLFAAGDRAQNLYTWGSMGLASSIGLGLALARPDLRPTPTARGADLEAAARAMGIAATATVRHDDELRQALHTARVIVAKVEESAPTAKPPLDCVFLKHRFMAAIGHPEKGVA